MRFITTALVPVLVLLAAGLQVRPAVAAADTELLELKNTVLNLVDELVAQGVISAEQAAAMKARAALRAREQVAEQALAAGRAADAPAEAPAPAGSTAVVRVPYVPEFVKAQIRDEVREELRAAVTDDVVAVARAEKWGTRDALPAWLSRLRLSGDLRLRAAGLWQDEDNNPTVPDFQAINEAGGPVAAGEDVFLNTTEDLTRGQVRLRLGVDAALSEQWSVTTRLATGNGVDPTTRNQRLGTDNRPFDVYLDLAYLEWRGGLVDDSPALVLRGGRVANPFLHTGLLFDDDLTFDGISAAWQGRPFDTGPRVFATLGGFALLAEEANPIDGGTQDKYWWGAQLGVEFDVLDDLGVMLAASRHDFMDVVGRRNDFNSTSRDWTAPAFIAKGNTVFDIRNDLDPDTQLFALASDFELLNLMFAIDYRGFAPVHVVLRGDYVENTGFDAGDVQGRVGVPVGERNQGWLVDLTVGHPKVGAAGQWNIFAGYRYLQRDAILDAFADSDFHAGGTDAEGFIVGASYGLADNVWLRARWLAADEIDGAPAGFGGAFAPLAIDVMQVDLNARF